MPRVKYDKSPLLGEFAKALRPHGAMTPLLEALSELWNISPLSVGNVIRYWKSGHVYGSIQTVNAPRLPNQKLSRVAHVFYLEGVNERNPLVSEVRRIATANGHRFEYFPNEMTRQMLAKIQAPLRGYAETKAVSERRRLELATYQKVADTVPFMTSEQIAMLRNPIDTIVEG